MNPILAALLGQCWALDALVMERLTSVILRWSAGDRLTAEQVAAAVGGAPQAAEQRRNSAASGAGGVAVIPLYGVMAHRAHMVQKVSGPGGTSTELFGRALSAALADPAVAAVLIDVDSPGGSVHGTQELADRIHAARGQGKPIVAIANATAASAAYWVASAADEVVATPSALVGSIGVITAHEDKSAKLAAEGTKVTFVHAGRYKAEGNSTEPLTDEGRAYAQAMVDQFYGVMVKSIARGRGVAPEIVRSRFGEGRTLTAADALAAGMIDRIETLDETIARLQNPRRRARMSNANALRLAQVS